MNRYLLKNISIRLDGVEINGCRISISTLKKKQEATVGADLVGVLEITSGARKISKAFLAQAKVAGIYTDSHGDEFFKTRSPDLLEQAEKMLRISSAAYFFLYSKRGIACVSALQASLGGSNAIDTATYPYHSFGSFFEEFFKCFIGDHRLSPDALQAKDLEDYADRLRAEAILLIQLDLPSQ